MAEEKAAQVVFERQYRTPYSEGYDLQRDGGRIGHLDLHFTHTSVYATLVIEEDLAEDEVLALVERIDDSLVLSAEVEREDLLVTVFRGDEIAFYSDDYLREREERRARRAKGKT